MADEEVKPVEEQVTETPPTEETKQEELPLVAATEEVPEEEQIGDKADETLQAIKAAERELGKNPTDEPKTDWREKELKAKHRQLKDAERREQEMKAKIDALEALAAKFNQPTSVEPAVVPVDEVDRRAKEILAQQQYVENCNKAAQEGESTYKEGWKAAVENLELLGGFDPATMNGVLATDAPAKVIYELGKNPDNYHRIMQLPLEKRIIEMGKLAMNPSSKPVSNAPAPVNPVGGRTAPPAQVLRDDMDDDKWYAIRRAQRQKKWEANNVRR
jgi:hypothetical protein